MPVSVCVCVCVCERKGEVGNEGLCDCVIGCLGVSVCDWSVDACLWERVGGLCTHAGEGLCTVPRWVFRP